MKRQDFDAQAPNPAQVIMATRAMAMPESNHLGLALLHALRLAHLLEEVSTVVDNGGGELPAIALRTAIETTGQGLFFATHPGEEERIVVQGDHAVKRIADLADVPSPTPLGEGPGPLTYDQAWEKFAAGTQGKIEAGDLANMKLYFRSLSETAVHPGLPAIARYVLIDGNDASLVSKPAPLIPPKTALGLIASFLDILNETITESVHRQP